MTGNIQIDGVTVTSIKQKLIGPANAKITVITDLGTYTLRKHGSEVVVKLPPSYLGDASLEPGQKVRLLRVKSRSRHNNDIIVRPVVNGSESK
jgi:hypothetical protein